MATVADFAARSGAEQVLVLLDAGDEDRATMLEWRAGAPLELTDGGITWEVPDELTLDAAPLDLPDVRPCAPASSLRIDAEAGVVEAPVGAVEALCDAVLVLASAFGGRSVASADYPTSDPNRSVTVAARPGEPAVLGVGDELFGLPESRHAR